MKNLFENNEKCIYLDQFASSEMFNVKNDETWLEIREELFKGFRNNKIICPLSGEHFMETSKLEKSKASLLDKDFFKLSKGYVFKSELFVSSQIIASKIRKNNITKNTFFRLIEGENVFTNDDKIDSFQKINEKFTTKISEATSLSNKIREYSRHIKCDNNTRKALLETHKSINVNEFLERLISLKKNKNIQIRAVHFKSGDVPHWVDLLIHQLTNTHKLTAKEINSLIIHIEKYGFNKIPPLDIKFSLSALISVENKKETVNDQIDMLRIATGLPVSDILLTDKQRKSELLLLGLDKKYNSEVFSGSKDDVKLLLERIKLINNS